jgi:hypothetical protein
MFPAGVFFVCFCLVFVARLFEADPFIALSAFAITACNWVLFPGVALAARYLAVFGRTADAGTRRLVTEIPSCDVK